jgi:twinkle protein
MKIQSTNTKQIYQYEPNGPRSICPECSHNRKKKTDKCLHWDVAGKRGFCHNCATSFFEYSPFEPKEYVCPEWKNITNLSDKAVKYFEGRMISQDTLVKMKVYSDDEFMPQLSAKVEAICFLTFQMAN